MLRDKEDYEFEVRQLIRQRMELRQFPSNYERQCHDGIEIRFPIKEEIGEVVGHVGGLARVEFKE